MDMELHPTGRQVRADDPDGVAHRGHGEAERGALLSGQMTDSNGEVMPSVHAAEAQDLGNAYGKTSKMNRVLFSKVRLWMVIVFISVLILAVILISLLVCAAIHEDPDDKFDSSLFQVPRYFHGSFQLPNLVFTEELATLSSNQSQNLTGDLEVKLVRLFNSSPALERYFSRAEINAFRNGSVIADYQLTFLMPEEEQDELRKFTLSREMVYNVLRQFLYDQDSDQFGLMYIDPVSLNML